MDDWEQTDALVKWLQQFEVETYDFVEDAWKLLSCRVLAQVFNCVSEESVDLESLRPVASESDWVNILLDLRVISSHITPLLKQSDVEVAVDLTALARKKDQAEFAKFLKLFFYYCMKAPNRKEAIARVRALDKPIQMVIQKILAEFKKEAPKTASPKKVVVEKSDDQEEKVARLREELKGLKEEEERLQKLVEVKSKEGESAANIQAKMEETLNAVRTSCAEAETKQKSLNKELSSSQARRDKLAQQIREIEQSDEEAQKATRSGGTELTLSQLEEKLNLMKRRASAMAEGEIAQPDDIESIIASMGIEKKQRELDAVQRELAEVTRGKDQKNAEIVALRGALEVQRKKASRGMLRRIAQLNAEMDKSPVGEAKRMGMKLKREIQRLGAEIEQLEKEGSREEVAKLQEEVERMAGLKVVESELLARKLSFMQSTVGQCGMRLQRLKLHVGLQTHANRLKRWKNCF